MSPRIIEYAHGRTHRPCYPALARASMPRASCARALLASKSRLVRGKSDQRLGQQNKKNFSAWWGSGALTIKALGLGRYSHSLMRSWPAVDFVRATRSNQSNWLPSTSKVLKSAHGCGSSSLRTVCVSKTLLFD